MTESEWLKCTDPHPMLKFLRENASDRKIRLFGVVCCRRLWNLLPADMRALVQASERYSDGESPASELYAIAVQFHPQGTSEASALAYEAARCCSDLGYNTSRGMDDKAAIALTAYYASGAVQSAGTATAAIEIHAQTNLLRDIFGNPFRPVSLNPTWQTPTVGSLAHAAYDNRTLPAGTLEPNRLAVLADALEEAGCDNADTLNHLRQPGDHVRGCWAVDLLLGKK